MKLLISAYSCEPNRGSEPGVAWNFIKELACSTQHELTVMTRVWHQAPIERYAQECQHAGIEEWLQRVRWVYLDPPRWYTFWAHDDRGVQLFYLIWQYHAYKVAKKMMQDQVYDRVHHITFGKWWVPGFIPFLPVPFVFGPVGGGDDSPPGYFARFSPMGKFVEAMKSAMSFLLPRLPVFRQSYRRMHSCVAATPATAQKLRGVFAGTISVQPQSAMSPSEYAQCQTIFEKRRLPPENAPVFVTASRMVHWKAIDVAVEAMAQVVQRFPAATLRIIGEGSEMGRIQKLVKALGINAHVQFVGKLPSLQHVFGELANATAYLHPALHEAFGQAVCEAMALHTPVVCFNWGGPGLLVDTESGFAISPSGDPKQDITAIADAMKSLAASPALRIKLGEGARHRAVTQFTWAAVAAFAKKQQEN